MGFQSLHLNPSDRHPHQDFKTLGKCSEDGLNILEQYIQKHKISRNADNALAASS